ncbi:MAG: hypothetical protein J5I93_13065 [Pirellulaceae bacterium]|nr:hypothetical protein [Pirellulaceae bacterium]
MLMALPVFYLLSVGPLTPLLRYHGGERGSLLWQSLYGEPLGRLPRGCREPVNRYLSVCDGIYWRIRRLESDDK